MSIVRLALRMATVRALAGATLAGANVFDSAIAELDTAAMAARKPYVAVYTDAQTTALEGRELNMGTRDVELVIELAVADQVEVPAVDPEGGPTILVQIPATDAGLEMTLDLLERQIFRVLTLDQGAWSLLWRDLVLRTERIEHRRAASDKDGLRYAGRAIVLTCQTVTEPDFGLVPDADDLWGQFLAALRADADPAVAAKADVIEAALRTPEDLPAWRADQAALGVSEAAAHAAGFAPADRPPSLPAVPTETITVVDELGETEIVEDEDDGA